MSRTWIGVIAFAAGVGAGLLTAKLYARHQARGAVSRGLGAIGLGGGAVEDAVQTIVEGLI